MNTHRSVQFDRATVEALLRGDSGVRQRAGRLGEHLAAAAAPARPYELAGLPAALDAFQAAGASPATDHRRISVTRTWPAMGTSAAAKSTTGIMSGAAIRRFKASNSPGKMVKSTSKRGTGRARPERSAAAWACPRKS